MTRFAEYSPDPTDPLRFPYKWNMWKEGLIVGLLSIGAIVGSLLGSPVGDIFGRRHGIFSGSVSYTHLRAHET